MSANIAVANSSPQPACRHLSGYPVAGAALLGDGMMPLIGARPKAVPSRHGANPRISHIISTESLTEKKILPKAPKSMGMAEDELGCAATPAAIPPALPLALLSYLSHSICS